MITLRSNATTGTQVFQRGHPKSASSSLNVYIQDAIIRRLIIKCADWRLKPIIIVLGGVIHIWLCSYSA